MVQGSRIVDPTPKTWRSARSSANYQFNSWWSIGDSNPGPLACQARAAEFSLGFLRWKSARLSTCRTARCRPTCGPDCGPGSYRNAPLGTERAAWCCNNPIRIARSRRCKHCSGIPDRHCGREFTTSSSSTRRSSRDPPTGSCRSAKSESGAGFPPRHHTLGAAPAGLAVVRHKLLSSRTLCAHRSRR